MDTHNREEPIRQLGKPKKIIIHCSDSEWGNEKAIDEWHKERWPSGQGYHFIILNGRISSKRTILSCNGSVVPGRSLQFQGAHCKSENHDSIGICLIGVKHFTELQMDALRALCHDLIVMYPSISGVFGHKDFDKNKTCPNFEPLQRIFG